MGNSERAWRGLLALAILGTIPLSTWGSGCSSQPLVQPDASGQSGGSTSTGGSGGIGGSTANGGGGGGGGHGSGGSGGGGDCLPPTWDGSVESECCTGSEIPECSSDGHELRTCIYTLNSGDAGGCRLPGEGYVHVWSVSKCPNDCSVTVNSCATGAGGFGSPANVSVTCN